MPKRGPVGFTRLRDIQNHFYTICAPCHPWHFFNTMNCFELRQTTTKLYLVHFLGMQSRHWLQEGVVCVVINCLVRQRGSCVTWSCLPARGNTIPAPATRVSLTRCHHVRRCLLSTAAMQRSVTPFCNSVWGLLDIHTTDLSHGWSHGWSKDVKTGRRYLVCGVGCTMLQFIQLLFYWKLDFVRGICVCGLYAYVGYMRENTVLEDSVSGNPTQPRVTQVKKASYTKTVWVCACMCVCDWGCYCLLVVVVMKMKLPIQHFASYSFWTPWEPISLENLLYLSLNLLLLVSVVLFEYECWICTVICVDRIDCVEM